MVDQVRQATNRAGEVTVSRQVERKVSNQRRPILGSIQPARESLTDGRW